MTSPSGIGELVTRDFLLQRLMEDSQRLRQNAQSSLAPSSRRRKGAPLKTDTSSTSTAETDSEENNESGTEKMFPSSNNLQLFQNPLHQYAATLAAARFMQAAAVSSHPPSPMIMEQYPMLYRSLFPSLTNGQGTLGSGIFPHSNTEKRMASISLSSPKQSQTTPSPRKRAPPKSKDTVSRSPILGGSTCGTPKKARAIRRIQFDDEMCSPVSGMYIKDLDDCVITPKSPLSQSESDAVDDTACWVDATDEAKSELAKIPNLIGAYVCRLCRVRYSDAFQLAKHKCPRIAHEEYRCPECEKIFSCPANLASHRRWHKPKNGHPISADTKNPIASDQPDDGPIDLSQRITDIDPSDTGIGKNDQQDEEEKSEIVSTPQYHECLECGKRFDAHRWLRAHAVVHTNFDHQNGDHRELQCSEIGCPLWFLSNDALEKHQRRAHPKFVCKFCLQSFPTSPALTRHINRQHPASIGECRVILLPQSTPSRA